MKITYLIIGFLVGAGLSFVLTRSFYQPGSQTYSSNQKPVQPGTSNIAPKWNWPDSLDAVKAAPGSHKVVYEDSAVRILQVILEPNKTEPLHTHQWRSVMWFTKATPMTYYKYGLISNNYIIKDSIAIPQMPQEVLNHGDVVDAEAPHAIKNLSNEAGIAYRVEFKKVF